MNEKKMIKKKYNQIKHAIYNLHKDLQRIENLSAVETGNNIIKELLTETGKIYKIVDEQLYEINKR